MAVAPVRVTLEKLLLVQFETAPETVEPLSFTNITVPPAPVLAKAVTIELPVTAFVPVAGAVKLWEIKVTLPVVFTLMLVNVLLLIVVN